MTNFEFYKDKLMAIADNGSDVALVKGEPVACDSVMCSQCELGEFNCGASLVHWLCAEHVEKPKINKRTKMFFDAIETGWVTRDKDGVLTIYTDIPIKCTDCNWWSKYYCDRGSYTSISGPFLDFISLDFIKWEDEKPWRVEDIRNLEVED